jgi:hypothetical protein
MYVDYGAPCLLSACYKVNILEMFGVAQTSDSKKKKKKPMAGPMTQTNHSLDPWIWVVYATWISNQFTVSHQCLGLGSHV